MRRWQNLGRSSPNSWLDSWRSCWWRPAGERRTAGEIHSETLRCLHGEQSLLQSPICIHFGQNTELPFVVLQSGQWMPYISKNRCCPGRNVFILAYCKNKSKQTNTTIINTKYSSYWYTKKKDLQIFFPSSQEELFCWCVVFIVIRNTQKHILNIGMLLRREGSAETPERRPRTQTVVVHAKPLEPLEPLSVEPHLHNDSLRLVLWIQAQGEIPHEDLKSGSAGFRKCVCVCVCVCQ